MTLPQTQIPRLPRTTTLPSADLIPDQTDTITPARGGVTDDLGRPGDTDTDLTPRFPEISELARKIADFSTGWPGRIADHVRETARAGVLVLVLAVLMACGQGPVPGPDLTPAPPVQVPAAPAPTPAAAPPAPKTPTRLKLPAVWVEVDGVKVPVGPYLDQDLNRPCQLQALADGSALCVPTDVVKIEAQTQTGYLDIDCTVPVARTQGAIEAWDGARVWRSLMGQPAIPDGTATLATRDQAGACKPARVIMAGGWAFTAGPTPAQLVYALVKRALD